MVFRICLQKMKAQIKYLCKQVFLERYLRFFNLVPARRIIEPGVGDRPQRVAGPDDDVLKLFLGKDGRGQEEEYEGQAHGRTVGLGDEDARDVGSPCGQRLLQEVRDNRVELVQ